MCGIAGLFLAQPKGFDPAASTAAVRRMIGTLEHRGPDAGGVWSDPAGRCVLGHRRLSIIDTSDAGIQPMGTGDGRWLISFNGEIYNFEDIKPALHAAGVSFRGRTDTEVLIEAIAKWGTDALRRLDGMFAFAAFDTLSGELLLARDAFGEKPLYYMELPDGRLAFASELQALEQVPGFDGTVDVNAMAEVLAFQYIGAPRSIYQTVKKLPPGHWLRVDAAGRLETGRYFAFRPGESGFIHRPMDDLVDELEDILVRSVRRRLISDVPLGAFLSGGVDSSTVCALIRRKLDRPLMTFSIGFKGAPESEHETAREFAKHLGTEHHDDILEPDAAEFLMDIGRLLDEPNADSSCLPTYLLSAFARRHVTVAMSGDGGDEMFGGYGRYFATLDEFNRRSNGELPGWQPGNVYFGNRILVSVEQHIQELFNAVPSGLAKHLGRLRAELDDADELLCAMRRSDAENYMPGAVLPKVDRMSMQHSLEVRTPFLTAEVARFAERLPDSVLVQGGRGKLVLRELAYRYLPRELIDLPKQGFGLPMSDWARTSLLGVAGAMLESEDSRLREALGPNAIARFMTRQRTPGQFSTYQVWALAMLESWFRHHPAKLPSLAAPAGARPARNPPHDSESVDPSGPAPAIAAPGEEYVLNLLRLAARIYLVSRVSAANPPLGSGGGVGSVSPDLSVRAIQLAAESKVGGSDTDQSFAELTLPDWGRALQADDAARLAPLRGATLLFADADTAAHLDCIECAKFTEVGVHRLVFRCRYVSGELNEIVLQNVPPLRRAVSLARLFTKRVGVVGNRRWMKLIGAKSFATADMGCSVSDVLKGVDAVPDEELSTAFAVFEGGRQLPPVRVAHVEIGAKGNGRYSVYNQNLYFAPTEGRRLSTKPYWLVRRTPETESYLPMLPEVRRSAVGDAGEVWSALDRLVAAHGARVAVGLQPGDPVVVCTHALAPGSAAGRQWVYLAQALSHAGYRVTFLTHGPLDGENAHYAAAFDQSEITLVDASQISEVTQIRSWPRTPDAVSLLSGNTIPERETLMKLVAALSSLRPAAVFTPLDEPNLLATVAGCVVGVPKVVMSLRNGSRCISNDVYLRAYDALIKSEHILTSDDRRVATVDPAACISSLPQWIASIQLAIEPAS
jgi:asparagine synthase (glutamine-hydrolysing)